MSDPADTKVRAWNDRAALVRHVWQALAGLVIVVSAASITYNTLAGDVRLAKEKAEKTERTVDDIKGKLNTLETSQKVMQTQMDAEQRNAAAFQMRTDTALDRIIQKLETLQYRDPR